MNTEFLGDDGAIFRVDVVHGLVFHCNTLRKWLDILTEPRGIMYVSESTWSWKGNPKVT